MTIESSNRVSELRPPLVGLEIAGLGVELPQRRINNHALAMMIHAHGGPMATAQAVYDLTGIRERPWASEKLGETTTNLGIWAGRAALENAGIDPGNPDRVRFLIFASSTQDRRLPNAVEETQDTLNLRKCFSFDLGAACSGFVHGVITASSLLSQQGEDGDCALVIGADRVRSIVDTGDFDTSILFADGAGAALLRRSDGSSAGLLGRAAWDNAGSDRDFFIVEHGSTAAMDGKHLAQAISRMAVSLALEALSNAGVPPEQLDHAVFHQSNDRFFEKLPKRTGIRGEAIVRIIDRIGNSSAATVPQALKALYESGRVKPGDTILLEGLKVGIGGSAIVLRV